MMRAARSLLLVALLPLFTGCQLLGSQSATPSLAGQTRLQGELIADNGKLLFQPCQAQQRYLIKDTGGTSILQEFATLADQRGKLFADLRGRIESSKAAGTDGQLNLQQLYRIEPLGTACNDPDFKRLILRATGHAPEWSLKVSSKGMVIERVGQPALALPYLEEQLGDGRFNLSSEANNQHIELWVAPQRCVDSASGSVRQMTAELRVNGQVQRGCAYFGGSRND